MGKNLFTNLVKLSNRRGVVVAVVCNGMHISSSPLFLFTIPFFLSNYTRINYLDLNTNKIHSCIKNVQLNKRIKNQFNQT